MSNMSGCEENSWPVCFENDSTSSTAEVSGKITNSMINCTKNNVENHNINKQPCKTKNHIVRTTFCNCSMATHSVDRKCEKSKIAPEMKHSLDEAELDQSSLSTSNIPHDVVNNHEEVATIKESLKEQLQEDHICFCDSAHSEMSLKINVNHKKGAERPFDKLMNGTINGKETTNVSNSEHGPTCIGTENLSSHVPNPTEKNAQWIGTDGLDTVPTEYLETLQYSSNTVNEPLLNLTKMVENIHLESKSTNVDNSSTLSSSPQNCRNDVGIRDSSTSCLHKAQPEQSTCVPPVISSASEDVQKDSVVELPAFLSDQPTNQSAAVHAAATDGDINTICIRNNGPLVNLVPYMSEEQMPDIMRLITKDLSEPYSIYTYRYFIHNWPQLCFLAMHQDKCIGAIVCKLDVHKKMVRRGYIAMLAVDENYRKLQIGSSLVKKAIRTMVRGECDEVVLETEITNKPALRLYENLGFVRDKRLFRYYLNGVDALRLKLWLR